MLTSPFDTGSVSRFDSNKFNQAQVIFVADMFVDEYVGGAELTTQALIDSSTTPTYWVKANHVTPELIQAGVGKHWVFCNYTSMQQQLIPVVIANLGVPPRLPLLAMVKLSFVLLSTPIEKVLAPFT